MAEGILDRVVHHAHRVELKGELNAQEPAETGGTIVYAVLSSANREGPQTPALPPGTTRRDSGPASAALRISVRDHDSLAIPISLGHNREASVASLRPR